MTDKCYSSCNKSRDFCDKDFKDCMARQCKRFVGQKHAKQREDCEGACCPFLFVAAHFLRPWECEVWMAVHAACSDLIHLLLLLLLLLLACLSSSGQASMFFTATRTLGCQTYLDSQKEACTCTFAEKVKKTAKDGVAAVKRVANAAGQAVKEAVAPEEGVSAGQQKPASAEKKTKQPAAEKPEKPEKAQAKAQPIRDDKDEL